MVFGKTQHQSLNRVSATARPQLPPLPKLRVRHPNAIERESCTAVMSSVLGCWASQGYTTAGCATVEHQLRVCMDTKKPENQRQNNINRHLSRFYPKIIGPTKRK